MRGAAEAGQKRLAEHTPRLTVITVGTGSMLGSELRARLDRLGMTYRKAAAALGLTERGLHHQMRNEQPVTRQTEIILEVLEQKLESQRRAA
jgi:hypothetical protein